MLCTAVFLFGILSQHVTADANTTPLQFADHLAESERQRNMVNSAEQRQQKLDEAEFVSRFNQLVSALHDFSTKYQAQHAIDVRNVKAIRKAYRKLEETEPWFKSEGFKSEGFKSKE